MSPSRLAGIAAALALVALALPYATWLVLAAWLAAALRPWLTAVARWLGGRRRAAAFLTVVVFVALVLPVLGAATALTVDAVLLGRRLAESESGVDALAQLVSPSDPGHAALDSSTVLAVLERYGSGALAVAQTILGVGAELVLGLFIFFGAAYVLLVDGPAAFEWALRRSPIDARALARLRAAFQETGRGLFIGIALTGLAQASVATVAYLVLGIPRALVLGLVTFLASIVPTFGTALVWVPVAIGLAITDRPGAAIGLAVVGVVLVSGIDNVLRPLLTRWGRLELHTFVVLLAMLGGLAWLGPGGLVLGPLLARLAVEVIRLARDVPIAAPGADQAPAVIRADGVPGRRQPDAAGSEPPGRPQPPAQAPL